MGKTVTNINFYTPWQKTRIARVVFALLLTSLIWSFFSGNLLHQLQQPVLKFPYVDPAYWLMHWFGIPEFITGRFWVACLFDLALFSFCILALCYPEKRLFIWLFIILYFIYFITFNTFGTHHTNHKIGWLMIAIPFTAANYKTFNFLWKGLRYFLLFIWTDAFLWKFFRLSWLHPNQGLFILKKNAVALLYYEPNSWKASLYHWALQNPGWVNAAYIAGIIMEGVFIVGFFTRKYDRYLLLVSILLPVGFWLIADANFVEIMVLNLTLVNFHKLFVRVP